jgi:hypothetical protein
VYDELMPILSLASMIADSRVVVIVGSVIRLLMGVVVARVLDLTPGVGPDQGARGDVVGPWGRAWCRPHQFRAG